MSRDIEKDFDNWKNVTLSREEKEVMLKTILATPLESPYARFMRVFAYAHRPLVGAMALILVISGTAYAAQGALPGDALYSVKTEVVEPLLGAFNATPERQVAWEEERVTRRLAEAAALVEKDALDEKKSDALEKHIDESAQAFKVAAREAAARAATSTEERERKQEEMTRALREKLQAVRTASSVRSEVGNSAEDAKGESVRAMKMSAEVETQAFRLEAPKSEDRLERLKERAFNALENRFDDNDSDREWNREEVR